MLTFHPSYFKKIFLLIFCLALAHQIQAQRWAVSTNVVECLNLGTLNSGVSCAIAQKWSVETGVRYNPFQYNRKVEGKEFQNKVRSVSLGIRRWPWHIYSGWWFAFYVQYQEYNQARVFKKDIREGDRYGGGLGLGYSYMLGKHFNLDMGIRLWTGMDQFRKYNCIRCGLTLDQGRTFFVLPDELIIAFSYVF